MVTRVVAAAVLVLALMFVAKDGRVLRAAGLTSSCIVVQRSVDGSVLKACRSGRIESRPDLTGDGCAVMGTLGYYEYWHCRPR